MDRIRLPAPRTHAFVQKSPRVWCALAGVLPTLAFAVPMHAAAQFDLQDSTTTASLRGISSPGNGVAWASGSDGTVLRTEDSGFVWQGCATPPGAEKLDFRGVQALDGQTAVVMSSGKGDLSRVYKTTDGCRTWKLVFTNPDAEGFFDGVQFATLPGRDTGRMGTIIGDPVDGKFPVFFTYDYGQHWTRNQPEMAATARDGEALFAASNAALLSTNANGLMFVTGGRGGSRSRVLSEYVKHDPRVSWKYVGGDIPFEHNDSAGAFSLASTSARLSLPVPQVPEPDRIYFADTRAVYVAVGGDYRKPDQSSKTAATSKDAGRHWQPAKTPPHGYRSSVAYDAPSKTWITVGPNGTDISRDDGYTWMPLRPGPGDAGNADMQWNALALPFVVGPHGRIGRLHEGVLTAKAATGGAK